jgi:hypothetical protein
MLLHYD